MMNRIRFEGNYDNIHKNVEIRQLYAWIYAKSKKKIVIVSKDGLHWQMPGGKPEKGETHFETLCREIYEETSIDIIKNLKSIHNLTLFGYYYIEEDGTEYLQLRYFIEIEDVDEKDLKPSEDSFIDSVNYVKLVDIDKITKIIPRLLNSGEFDSFSKIIGSIF